ncbi:hypothetical protein SAMN05216249_11172 [Acetitomaculum ruminis DSM 5522]|uniref:Uncharacterized protein n=1 Tax=Acetitomaculum ruminis DSM 5522 TaxID=1120918 RepID=A0A1I0YU89_9FIRM|nr:DUF6219 family protein [Acetitomaculum ruminis]SFB16945.1 hypothetical protein SAMN05216249_11172 [Acetitomaculum ruminis DSM 5522]
MRKLFTGKKAHKCWGIASMVCMLICIYTGYKMSPDKKKKEN